MYYSTTSILPSRPNRQNNARVKFMDALLKKLAKEKIKKNTKTAANQLKRVRLNKLPRLPKRSTANNAVQQIWNRYYANAANTVLPVLPLYSTNLYLNSSRKTRSKTPSKKYRTRK